jgi:acyl carrier protein
MTACPSESEGVARPRLEVIGSPEVMAPRLRRMLAAELGYAEEDIRADTDLRNDLGLDSLTTVELLAQLSDEFTLGVDVRLAQKLAARVSERSFDGFVREFCDLLQRLDELAAEVADEAEAIVADAESAG